MGQGMECSIMSRNLIAKTVSTSERKRGKQIDLEYAKQKYVQAF